jgi:tRNA wybutosine-synthesizing protein 1
MNFLVFSMAKARKRVRKKTYEPVLNHSAVQLCNWTKKSLKNEGSCFKEKFYGIKSHKCCQMTCSVLCNNRCIHCWRDISNAKDGFIENPDEPLDILKGAIKAQQKLLTGFNVDPNSDRKQLSKADQKKLEEAQIPNQFALSLTGEPTLYPKIGELINEIRKRDATSFLVTNGLQPEVIEKLIKENNLPTRLYVSVNTSNKESYDKFHRSLKENAWEKLNETLKLFKKIDKPRTTVFRMNLVRELNMDNKYIPEFAKMIRDCVPDFIEIKGYMSVGFARERMGYEMMPTHEEMLSFVEKLEEALRSTDDRLPMTAYKLQDSHEASRAYVLCKDSAELKIRSEDK